MTDPRYRTLSHCPVEQDAPEAEVITPDGEDFDSLPLIELLPFAREARAYLNRCISAEGGEECDRDLIAEDNLTRLEAMKCLRCLFRAVSIATGKAKE